MPEAGAGGISPQHTRILRCGYFQSCSPSLKFATPLLSMTAPEKRRTATTHKRHVNGGMAPGNHWAWFIVGWKLERDSDEAGETKNGC